MKRTYKRKSVFVAGLLMISLMTFLTGCQMGDTKEASKESEIVEEDKEITINIEPSNKQEEIEEEAVEEPMEEVVEEPEEIEKASPTDVDLIFFMGQSNMSGCGGDASLAPKVIDGAGYELKTVTDPFNLREITEPFGLYESVIGGICDTPEGKKGSLVSAFINEYYEKTGRSVIAVSASAGATSTEDWLTQGFITDLSVRMKNAQDFLDNNGYTVGHKYVVWLQGESDALDRVSFDEYKSNMDTIIRPLFIGGFTKVFIITPGRIKSNSQFFNNIIAAQIDMCKNSGYYALASTMLCAVDRSYMVDEWHYNQNVLNLLGKEAADSVAYYTNERKEMCIYNYKNDETYIPLFFDYSDDVTVEKMDVNGVLAQQ